MTFLVLRACSRENYIVSVACRALRENRRIEVPHVWHSWPYLDSNVVVKFRITGERRLRFIAGHRFLAISGPALIFINFHPAPSRPSP